MTTSSSAEYRKEDGYAAATRDRSSASIGELVAEASSDLTLLIRQEVQLAKAEARQSVTRGAKGTGMLGGAGLAAHLTLVFASVAVWWALGDAIGHGWSGLVVAVAWAVIAAVLAALGRRELRAVQAGIPRTVDSAKKIPSALLGNEEGPHE
jgi:Putative Actinobacterial Holin-X, holin superfamily III